MTTDRSSWRERLAGSAASVFPGTPLERILALSILLLAALLRFWDLSNAVLTHDELSALLRVDYPTLSEAISKGIVGIDTHPPGTHAFLWCWTKLFGFGTFAVKLPFVLFSLAGLFLLYRLAHAWTSPATALAVITLFGTLQFGVMYGQIARPYAMGFFTVMLAADQLTRFVAKGSVATLVGLTIGLLASAYTHHFALMEACLIFTTGMFLVPPDRRKSLLIAGAACVLAYLPNLSLFITQLSMKGLEEWLSEPGPDWIPQFGWWLSHFSEIAAGALVALVLLSAYLQVKNGDRSLPVWVIALTWGVAPLVIGYGYSIWRSPVLQYSMLLFSFPFIALGLLAGLRHLRANVTTAVVIGTAAINVFTLVTVREHYTLFYRSKYDAMVNAIAEGSSHPERLVLVDAPDEVIHFLLKRKHLTTEQVRYVQLKGRSATFLDSLLSARPAKEVFLGETSDARPENPAIVQAHFPFLIARSDMADGQTFLFGGRPGNAPVKDVDNSRTIAPEAVISEGWAVESNVPRVLDTTTTYPGPRHWDFTGREYGVVFEDPMYKLVRSENDLLEVSVDVEHGAPDCHLNLVVELKEMDSVRFYRAAELGRDVRSVNGKATLIASIKLADMSGHGTGQRMRAYLWNRDKHTVWVNSMSVRVRQGDPVLYGFFQPFKGPWRFQ